MRALLEVLLQENHAIITQARHSVQRQVTFSTAPNMIKVAIGMRRVGKTYCLYQTIHALLNQGVLPEQILLLNFEDERLRPMHAQEMGKLVDAFYALYPENHQRMTYLFLDEVHTVTDWHLVVRRLSQTKQVQIYLTGSSAKLLSKEIHTSLRGRSLATEIWPFSFAEFLLQQHYKKSPGPFGQISYDRLFQHLLHYFSVGGFPAVQSLSNYDWRETLQGYIESTIIRDIIERYSVSNVALLRYLANTLLKNAASIFSVNKFYNDAKSQGYKIAKDTIHHYLTYLEDAFLCFLVPLYSESKRAASNHPKKIYAIDHGLVQALSLQTNDQYGKLFENLLYIDLRRQHKKVFYYQTKDAYEIDFVTIDKEGKRECLQICWNTENPETLAREERALQSAQKELKITGRLITPREYLREINAR